MSGLAVKDALRTHPRPKVERYGETFFVVLKAARYVEETETVEFGEIHAFVGPDFVVTDRYGEASELRDVRRWIVETLREAGVEAGDISLILLTHGHVDHFGSAAELKRITGAPVAVHEKDAENLRRGRNPHLTPMSLEGRLMKPLLKTEAPPVEPDVIFSGEMSLEAYGVDARVIETPGHTAGSVSVVTADGEAIVGDVVAGGYLGFTLRPHAPRYHLFVEDVGAVQESISRLLDLAPTRLLPGHGGPLDPEAVRARFFGDGSGGRG